MSAARKTFPIAKLLLDVNLSNCHGYGPKEARQKMNEVMEDILKTTGNFIGFEYLTRNMVPKGAEPAVIYTTDRRVVFDGCDQTRIYFYVSRALENDYEDLAYNLPKDRGTPYITELRTRNE